MKLMIVASALALSGCALTPPLQRPAAPIPAAYPDHPELRSDKSAAEIGWRSMFGDTRLQRLIEIALQNNRDLRLAVLNVEQVRTQYDIQKVNNLPRLDGAVSYTRERAIVAGNASTQTQAGVRLSAAYELDLFGRVRAASDAAFARYLASDEGRRAAQITLVGAVADAYYAERLAKAQLELAGRTADDWRTSLELARRLVAARRAGALELSQAEGQVAASEADREARQREVEVRGHALALLIGQQLPDGLPAAAALIDASVITELPAGLPSELLIRRPDLRQAELALVATHAEVGVARAALFPRISLTASAGTVSPGLKGLFQAGSGVWTFAPQLTQPLFNAGQLKTELRLAELRKTGAVLEYERAVQTAFREVADGLSGREHIARQADAQRRAVLEQRSSSAAPLVAHENRPGPRQAGADLLLGRWAGGIQTMREFFGTFPWFGSTLLEIRTEQDISGNRYEVRLTVRWPDGNRGVIWFRDCLQLDELQPAGVDELILTADLTDVYVAGQEGMARPAGGLQPVRRYSFTTTGRPCSIQIEAAHFDVLVLPAG